MRLAPLAYPAPEGAFPPLSAAQEAALQAALDEVQRNLRRPFACEAVSPEPHFNEAFALFFAYKILEYENATGGVRLNKKPFEAALAQSLSHIGLRAWLTDDETHPGQDVNFETAAALLKTFSCKTEGGKTIAEKTLKISKLQEFAGIRHLKSKEDAAELLPRIEAQIKRSDSILMLRCFDGVERGGELCRRYDLVEIPDTTFDGLAEIPPATFAEVRKNGGTKVVLMHGEQEACKVIFDGSDEKVTLHVPAENCIRHCSWWFPQQQVSATT